MTPIQGSKARPSLIPTLQEALGGRVYTDVGLCATTAGQWPASTADHRIDAVVVPNHSRAGIVAWGDHVGESAEAIENTDAYIAVARDKIGRPLLGLLLAATDMLSRSYPHHGLLRQVAVVERAQANVAWVYERRGVRIIRA